MQVLFSSGWQSLTGFPVGLECLLLKKRLCFAAGRPLGPLPPSYPQATPSLYYPDFAVHLRAATHHQRTQQAPSLFLGQYGPDPMLRWRATGAKEKEGEKNTVLEG